MAFTKCNVQKDVIGSLGTNPSERGLTTKQFKDKFDEMPEGIVDYINETHLKEIFRPVGIINGNFRHPVNQYGRVSGAAFSSVGNYFVDMWKLNMGSVTWTAGTGFSLNGMMTQYFEAVPTDLFGETIPITINVGGVDYVKHMTFPNDTSSYDTETAGGVTINIGFSTKTATLCDVSVTHVPYISLTTSSAVTIKYIYSVAPPADYGEELRKCKRYLKDLAGIYRLAYRYVNVISFSTENIANGMRISAPSIIVNGSEPNDWRVATLPDGSIITGFTLTSDPNGWGTLAAIKTGHGLDDAVIAIKPGKVFASAEL